VPTVDSFTIYHSPNAYLGVRIAERALAELPVEVRRRPIAIPRSRGVKVADLVDCGESTRRMAYTRQDCRRWANAHGITINFLPLGVFEERAERWAQSSFAREELPARAYYAALGSGKEAALDRELFEAAWIRSEDVNEEAVVRQAIANAGLDADELLERAMSDEITSVLDAALADFDALQCPGIPTWVYDGELYWGKDRIDWLVESIRNQ